ncbi:hypothetical protein AVEN_199408-1, partial [Araneus ventricosus]
MPLKVEKTSLPWRRLTWPRCGMLHRSWTPRHWLPPRAHTNSKSSRLCLHNSCSVNSGVFPFPGIQQWRHRFPAVVSNSGS